jgi:hypothetical protein
MRLSGLVFRPDVASAIRHGRLGTRAKGGLAPAPDGLIDSLRKTTQI